MSYMEISKNVTKTVLMVIFSGRQQGIANMTIFEFKNFLEDQYPEYDKLFLKDERVLWYTQGITGISSDIKGTIDYLKEYISRYSKVVFIGASMGGWAALLYGSILNVDTIIAFRPQTFLSIVVENFIENPNQIESRDKSYDDIKPFINNETKYYIYGDSSIEDENDIHSIKYCDYLETENTNINQDETNNMIIFRIPNFDIKDYKDREFLSKDFKKIIQ